MLVRLSENSEFLSPSVQIKYNRMDKWIKWRQLLLELKLKLSWDVASHSHSSFMKSSLPAHLRILERFSMDSPKVVGLSHLYSSKASLPFSRDTATKATCEESIAWMNMPS